MILKKSIGICKNESRASPPARSGSVAGPRDLADYSFEYFCGFQNSIGLFVETLTGQFLCPIYFSKIVPFWCWSGARGRAPGPGRARVVIRLPPGIVFYSLHARPGFETPLSSYGEWAIRYIFFDGFAKRKMKVLDSRGVGIAPNGINNCNPETT
jgi:hypothetical protein